MRLVWGQLSGCGRDDEPRLLGRLSGGGGGGGEQQANEPARARTDDVFHLFSLLS